MDGRARPAGPCGLPVVGSIRDGVAHCQRVREPAIIAAGSRCTAFRWGLYRRLNEAGVPLASVIHPSTVRAPGVEIGPNAIVFPGVTLAKGVRVGAMCTFWSNALVEHDSVVGDNVTIGPAAKTSGYVTIGRHAFLGIGATIAPKIHIGARALIGAGAVVVRDVEPGMVMAGVPAGSCDGGSGHGCTYHRGLETLCAGCGGCRGYGRGGGRGRPGGPPVSTHGKTVAVLQSNYIPWKGYFDIIHDVDEVHLL